LLHQLGRVCKQPTFKSCVNDLFQRTLSFSCIRHPTKQRHRVGIVASLRLADDNEYQRALPKCGIVNEFRCTKGSRDIIAFGLRGSD
jgi:hypothetical protein